jgi:arylsulfatase A-like enzyme
MHGEHGLGGHPQQFWEEVIHVPCGMSSPRLEGNTINKQIAHIDLPATMLDLIGIQQPSGWPGRSLPPSKKDEWEAREHVFVDVEPELNRDHAGVRRADNWKLMRHDDDGELLLDVNTNPEEDPTGDKTDSATERYEVLSTVLDDHLDDMEQQRRGEMAGIEDEEMVEQHLKELGYLE